MILVTVGTHDDSFRRLLEAVDRYAAQTDERIVMQCGHSEYEPTNTEWFTFIESEDEFLALFEEADLVIGHAGAGTILTALRFGHPIIIVPRRKKFGEHIDDQQLELVEGLEETDGVYPTEDLKSIGAVIERVRQTGTDKERSGSLPRIIKRDLLEST